jgi:hypothetical protein
MARTIEVEVVGDTRSLERAFKRAGTSGRSLEPRLVSVGKKAAFALGALGVTAGVTSVKLVKMAGDAEEVRSKFRTVFQSEMPRMVNQLDAFSKATGASRFQLREQAADLGALLVPLVGSRREAANLSVGFTKLATDLSSFNNVPVADALTAIRAGLVGEAEPLRRFGVLLNEAAVKAEAYRSGIAKSGEALTETQKVQARANLIMQQTKLAQGDATRTADSFTNQWRKLQNQVSDTATSLGLKFLPIATTVLDKLNEWGPAIAQRVQPYLDDLGSWADQHKQEFKDLFEDIAANARTAGARLREMAGAADNVAGATGGWDNAFQLVLSGVLVSQLGKVTKKLGGTGGILPLLNKLKVFGPLTLTVYLLMNTSDFEKAIGGLNTWINQHPALRGALQAAGLWNPVMGHGPRVDATTKTPRGTVADPRGGVGGGTTGSLSGTGGSVSVNPRTLPAGQGAKPIKSHVIEFVRRVSGIFGAPLTIWDNSTHNQFVAGTNNKVQSQHWTGDAADIPMSGAALTRLGQAALIAAGASPSVAYKQTGGAYNVNGVNILFNTKIGGNHFDHLHVGLTALPAERASGGDKKVSPGAKKASGGGTSGAGAAAGAGAGGGSAASAALIPAGMRLALAKAEGTKNIGDDLTALRAMVAYLEKLLPKTKDVEKRIEITEALNGLRDRISELGKTGTKADVSDVIDYDALKKKLRDQFRDGIEKARQGIVDSRAKFSAAFGILSDSLLTVFDAKTERMLENLRVKVAGFNFTIGAGDETPAEAQLRQLRERRSDESLAQALRSATTAEDIAQARAAIEEDALEKQARAERAAADKALADEARRIQEERSLQRHAFTNALADLEAHWARTNATTKQRTADLNALMAKFNIPFQEVGSLLGTSFADGFLSSMQIVFDRLADLARELNKITPAQAAEAVILAGGTALAARSAALNAKYGLGSLPTFQQGGVVPGFGPQLAIVHGGETVIPRGQASSQPIVMQVVLDGRVIAEAVRKENVVYQQNGGSV